MISVHFCTYISSVCGEFVVFLAGVVWRLCVCVFVFVYTYLIAFYALCLLFVYFGSEIIFARAKLHVFLLSVFFKSFFLTR